MTGDIATYIDSLGSFEVQILSPGPKVSKVRGPYGTFTCSNDHLKPRA